MTTIADILTTYGMTIKQLSDRFNIPYKTVQNWTATGNEHRNAPEYVVNMINEILKEERI